MSARGAGRKTVRLAVWAEEQRRLAAALGLSPAEWSKRLQAAAERRLSVLAAAVGAAVSSGRAMPRPDAVDPERLGKLAAALLGDGAAAP